MFGFRRLIPIFSVDSLLSSCLSYLIRIAFSFVSISFHPITCPPSFGGDNTRVRTCSIFAGPKSFNLVYQRHDIHFGAG